MNYSKNKNVLIVDDDLRATRLLERVLAKNYYVKTAQNAEQALDILADWQPAVVLLDVMLPGMCGLELCQKLKAANTASFSKIILVSGKTLPDERLEGYAAGADDYLTKPYIRDELEAKVKVFTKLFNMEFNLHQLNKSLEAEVLLRTQENIKSEKMAAIGMQAAEIVHNLINPLSGIKGSAYLLKREHPDSVYVDMVIKASEKLHEIIQGILEDTKNVCHEREQDLVQILSNEAETLCGELFSSLNISIINNSRQKVVVKGSETHFRQIFSNLLKNAIDAMEGVTNKKLTISSYRHGNEQGVSIEDNGEGIPQENISEIFNPFFTTKKNSSSGVVGSSGTGLGLSSCKRMIEAYNGYIDVESLPGQGTTFSIRFPTMRVA